MQEVLPVLPRHDAKSRCPKKPYDDALNRACRSTPSRETFLNVWLKPMGKSQSKAEGIDKADGTGSGNTYCKVCRDWIGAFEDRIAQLLPTYEWKDERELAKINRRHTRILLDGTQAFFFYRFDTAWPMHTKHDQCSKKEFDSVLAQAIIKPSSQKKFIEKWMQYPERKNREPIDCQTCRLWIQAFGQRAAELIPTFEWESQEQQEMLLKRCKKVGKYGSSIYWLNTSLHIEPRSAQLNDDVEAAAPVEVAVPKVNRWRVKNGDSASARAKNKVVQNLLLFLCCCGGMPILGFLQGLLLFPFGVILAFVLSAVLASGLTFRAFQYFFFYSELGVGYKIVWAWVPLLYVICVVPITFVGSLVFSLISSLVLPPIWMIKYDTWLPAVATLDWQYNDILPKALEMTFGSKGAEIAKSKRPRLESFLRKTIGLLLLVPGQALLLTCLVGPIFAVVCIILILPAIPLRFTQWFWVYGAFRDWHLHTAPFWIALSPLWLIVMLLFIPISILCTLFVCLGSTMIMPFYFMLDKGDLFPLATGTLWAFKAAIPRVHSETLGPIGAKRVRTERKLHDLHCWWVPCIPLIWIAGFIGWFVALTVLLLVRFIPIYANHMNSIWSRWYRRAGFGKPIDDGQRLSAVWARLGWLILAIPMVIYSVLFFLLEVPLTMYAVFAYALYGGFIHLPLCIVTNEVSRITKPFGRIYRWTNKYYFPCCNPHTGCLDNKFQV